ncbi:MULTISPECIES: branched-chain amino acid ABC transporter permease [Rhodomicrobium]|uniref:branched-chain amino acid ABC transporter permease n=1 Tax=Rhodomicrobium TaxID=1068 RepID=UPI000B4BB815|nr:MULTISPECIES: branched-chain amino acid ABC transporter permease [Rhodomicrobium]
MSVLSETRPLAASGRRWPRDVIGLAAIALAGGAGYVLFPDSLAFLTRIISIALLVLSLDLLIGYCGIATLGQSALYGAGAYAAGIAAVNGLTDPVALIAVGALAGGVAGLLMGAVLLRAHGLPQLVLSIAFVQLFHEMANKAASITGGSDGLYGIAPGPLFGLFAFDLYGKTAFFAGLGLLLLVFAALSFVVRSPFGMTCRGIKEDPLRIRAMGIGVRPTLIKMFALSGAVAGMGGALGAIATQVVGLDSVSFELSANALVMLVLGGFGSLYGALIGTVIFLGVEHEVSAINPFHWMTLVGVMLIAVVLFAPRGLYGVMTDAVARWRGRP